jgi:hypothetical protein
MLRKTLLVLAMLMSTSAGAETVQTVCQHDRHGISCTTNVFELPSGPRVITRQPETDLRWRAFCKPVVVTDELGVGHYRYAHAGCEYGRSQ